MFLNLFKSSSNEKNTQSLSKSSVSNELNSLLNDLTIDSTNKHDHKKVVSAVKEKATAVVSSLERQIEENQIIYAKIMQERMMRTRRKLV
ncbi:hypothetical protein QSV08_13880 [Maribacter sp. BPC-D8]|uniref:hypothetical protein n=1 Tax=Maribacter sp. BPC-D8 TaxID=3053613 RepID=UPI002B495077|nr:hypothetical protein [Maribacter sp. BPC-D8]WRI28309.1 hypothetical protein QSV08_13880 [Maribacter sp. BPC-D8]